MMYVALCYQHRIVDGQGAVQFLVELKRTADRGPGGAAAGGVRIVYEALLTSVES